MGQCHCCLPVPGPVQPPPALGRTPGLTHWVSFRGWPSTTAWLNSPTRSAIVWPLKRTLPPRLLPAFPSQTLPQPLPLRPHRGDQDHAHRQCEGGEVVHSGPRRLRDGVSAAAAPPQCVLCMQGMLSSCGASSSPSCCSLSACSRGVHAGAGGMHTTRASCALPSHKWCLYTLMLPRSSASCPPVLLAPPQVRSAQQAHCLHD